MEAAAGGASDVEEAAFLWSNGLCKFFIAPCLTGGAPARATEAAAGGASDVEEAAFLWSNGLCKIFIAPCLTGGAPARAMEAAAGGASDVEEAAFWWSNCVQLRWMLWAMSHAAPELELPTDDAGHPADDFDWVMQVCRSFTVLFPAQLAHRQRRSC